MKSFKDILENKWAESPADQEFAYDQHDTTKIDYPVDDEVAKDNMFKGGTQKTPKRNADPESVEEIEDNLTDEDEDYDDEDYEDEFEDYFESVFREDLRNRFGPKSLVVEVTRGKVGKDTFSPAQLGMLKKEFGKIEKIDPNSPSYKKAVSLLSGLPQSALKQILLADIKFLSALARTRLKEEAERIEESTYKVSLPGHGFATVTARSEKEATEKALKKLKLAPFARRDLKGKKAAKVELVKEETLTEVYREGVLSLKDGSEVKIDKVTAEALNNLYVSLNLSNRKKMDEAIVTDKETFERIASFAKGDSEE